MSYHELYFALLIYVFLPNVPPFIGMKIDMNNELKLGHMFSYNMKYRYFDKLSDQTKDSQMKPIFN